MAEHTLSITTMPVVTVGKSDVIFQVKRGRNKLGRLRVSRGNIVWLPKGYTYGYALDWDKLGEVAEQNGKRRRYKF